MAEGEPFGKAESRDQSRKGDACINTFVCLERYGNVSL
jgi:hypothetical protein